ncbi:MAG TPA: hypothetical protein VGS58_17380, partial [Candidatus Sulfopaludibacter sp.]|nr:hypothetical protein [Candidatus Sulfopaludibacter sp.]
MSAFESILIFFAASQLYWGWRCYQLLSRRIAARWLRLFVMAALAVAWFYLFDFNFSFLRRAGGSGHPTPVYLSWSQALLAAPFLWWVASSMIGFLVALLIAIVRAPVALARKTRSSTDSIDLPARRHFLEQAATSVPFFAGGYGLLYGRLNLETTAQPIRLPRLPRAFEGFRICQLSDIHIGPFMPAAEIRKYVAIADSLKADLMVLTGDFVTMDGRTQAAAVDALRGL